MQCPYCQGPVCEESPACPRCGLAMEKAGAFFGAVPRLVRGVSDTAGVLSGGDTRGIRRSIAAFERRFPQCGFTAAFMALGKDVPGAAYTFWVFNRTNPAGGLNQGSRNRHILLLVDTQGCGAWLTLGYGLEPFISRKTMDACLERAQPHFYAGKWRAGVAELLIGIDAKMREIVRDLPRLYGLPPRFSEDIGRAGAAVTAW